MSPVHDPRFSEARRSKSVLLDQQAGERAARMEYIKPLVMLLVGGVTVVVILLSTGADDPNAPSGAIRALAYPIGLALELAFGVAGLWVAAKLWLGGAGPLGLAILRLAGIYATTDLIGMVVAPLQMVGWIITLVLYVVMLAWLFDFEVLESAFVALITFLLKIFGGVVIFSLITGIA
jgi:hypothetical protein